MNDLIKAAINVSHKMKCEYRNSKFANLDSLKRNIRKFHEPMIKEEKLYTCDICHKTFPHPSKLTRHTSTHIAYYLSLKFIIMYAHIVQCLCLLIECMLPNMQLCYLCDYDWPIFCRPLNIRSI